ncbi:hypothetical protein STEG23_024570 [Scotinomys teguina]
MKSLKESSSASELLGSYSCDRQSTTFSSIAPPSPLSQVTPWGALLPLPTMPHQRPLGVARCPRTCPPQQLLVTPARRCGKGKHWTNECRSTRERQGNPLPPSLGNDERDLMQAPTVNAVQTFSAIMEETPSQQLNDQMPIEINQAARSDTTGLAGPLAQVNNESAKLLKENVLEVSEFYEKKSYK